MVLSVAWSHPIELTHYAHTEDESFLTHVNKLTHLNNTAIAKKRINAKQCTLNDFFIKLLLNYTGTQ